MELSFSFRLEESAPELERVSVSHVGLEAPIVSVRGVSAGAFKGASSFPWSSSVKALSILALNAKSMGCSSLSPHLSGERGTPASSLDYALSKQPSWLHDVFGSDAEGNTYARRFILRTNPNGKHPGPISLSLKSVDRLSIFVNGFPVTERERLQEMARVLSTSWRAYGTGRREREAPTLDLPIEDFQEEVRSSLSSVNIFSKAAQAQHIKALLKNRYFSKLAGKHVPSLYENELSLSPSQLLGLADESWVHSKLSVKQPMRVAVPISAAGACAIFWYMARERKLPLLPDTNFGYALEIANRILRQDPQIDHDLVAIANAPAASLIANQDMHDYRPVMFLPKTSQRIVSPQGSKRTASPSKGHYGYLLEHPSTGSFYFDSLVAEGRIERKKVSESHLEPADAFRLLRQGDPDLRAILFFPYFSINQRLNNCLLLDDGKNAQQTSELILFAKEEFLADRPRVLALNLAVRNAWLSLLENESSRKVFLNKTYNDPIVSGIMRRASGLSMQEFA